MDRINEMVIHNDQFNTQFLSPMGSIEISNSTINGDQNLNTIRVGVIDGSNIQAIAIFKSIGLFYRVVKFEIAKKPGK